MGNSASSDGRRRDERKPNDRQQHANLPRFQNALLIWLDNTANDNTKDSRKTITRLRRTVRDMYIFTDDEQCLQFIQTVEKNKVCMVISGSLGQHVVPRVHNLFQVESIFIFCVNKKYHEQWTEGWPKIRGVFTEIAPICEALRQTARQCEQNATPMSFLVSDITEDRLDPSFMYTQIIKEILFKITFNEDNIRDYTGYCREEFQSDRQQLKYIKRLERHYRTKTPIWWYSKECFLYRMLNNALRTMDADIIIRMGFFVNDLHRDIEREHQKQYANRASAAIFTVYRGQELSTADFRQLTQSRGGLMSFNYFLSTSKKRHVSLKFTENERSKRDMVGILFVMKIDPSQSTTPFASIRKLGAMKHEDEVLFDMHSVFRVCDIKQLDESSKLYEVHLTLTNDNDPQLRELTDFIKTESIPKQDGWRSLGFVLKKIGQLDKAQEIYQSLLAQKMSDDGTVDIYNQLGAVKHAKGEYQEAMELFERALAMQKRSLPPNHPHLAATHNNIGGVYHSMGYYSKALLDFEKALAIQQESLPSVHPDLASSYNNVAGVYHKLGDYRKALATYKTALTIRQELVPHNHPSLASLYNNIGNVHHSTDNYSEALATYQKALDIQQRSLPHNHPDLAASHSNVGLVYNSMGDYLKALASHEQALAIHQALYPPNYIHLAAAHSSIGIVYKSIGDCSQALASHETALAILQRTLPPTHPDLALAYHNIGSVYHTMKDYPKALANFELGLAIQQQVLPSNHPHMVAVYNNIGTVHKNMGNYAEARFAFERAIHIAEQSPASAEHAHLELMRKNLAYAMKKL